jgi:uncharacterized protein YndB with AHSA1/START domain
MNSIKTLRKEVLLLHAPTRVWVALTDARALAEWLMPNDFRPEVGRTFQFRVDPMLSFQGIVDCEVLEVEPPRRLVYTWVSRMKGKPPHLPMTLIWTLVPTEDGTRLVLEQSGLENLTLWWRFSMKMGWGRMLKTLLPTVLDNVSDGDFTPGAITKRDYGVKTVPDEFAK